MSYADLPPFACYVPEMHLETYWRVKYDGQNLLMTEDEFWEFADQVKYDEVEYEAQQVQRPDLHYALLLEAAM
jgi:hypothetical protein